MKTEQRQTVKGIGNSQPGSEGAAFLKSYFRMMGVTDPEIKLCREWGIFDNCTDLCGDANGYKYAEEMVRKIKQYRTMTHDDLRENYNGAPWAWPSAMCFQKVLWDSVREVRCLPGRPSILMCEYRGNRYFFNVGKEEPSGAVLEKMLDDGEWYVYTYRD